MTAATLPDFENGADADTTTDQPPPPARRTPAATSDGYRMMTVTREAERLYNLPVAEHLADHLRPLLEQCQTDGAPRWQAYAIAHRLVQDYVGHVNTLPSDLKQALAEVQGWVNAVYGSPESDEAWEKPKEAPPPKREPAKREPPKSGRGTSTSSTSRGRLDATSCAVEVLQQEADVYLTPDDAAYVGITLSDAEGTVAQHRLDTLPVKDWLAYHTHRARRFWLNGTEIDNAIRGARGWAREQEGRRHEVYVRLAPICAPDGLTPAKDAAGFPLGFYLDTGRGNTSIRVTAEGWDVGAFNATCANPAGPHFLRYNGMQALPEPVRGGTLDVLRPLLNAADDDRWHLMQAFLLATVMPHGDYPFLLLNGPQGAGKSKITAFLRTVVDPNTAQAAQEPNGWKDVMIQANQSWVVAYDNLGGIPNTISDIFCRLSTGFAARDRKFYTNDEALLYNVKRPCVVNGIGDLVTRGDLANRTLLVSLPPLDDHRAYTATTIEQAFREAHPKALGALLDLAVACLRALPQARAAAALSRARPRLGDFYEWVLAAEMSGALGWEPGTWQTTFGGNQVETTIMATVTRPYVDMLVKYLREAAPRHRWEGSASDLFTLLTERARLVMDIHDAHGGWPRNYNSGWSQLTNSRKELSTLGITSDATRSNVKRGRVYVYDPATDQSLATVRAVTEAQARAHAKAA